MLRRDHGDVVVGRQRVARVGQSARLIEGAEIVELRRAAGTEPVMGVRGHDEGAQQVERDQGAGADAADQAHRGSVVAASEYRNPHEDRSAFIGASWQTTLSGRFPSRAVHHPGLSRSCAHSVLKLSKKLVRQLGRYRELKQPTAL